MSVVQIEDAMPGESLIGIEPKLLQQVDAGWRHRLALFNGRTLTATALESEQAYRAGRLAVLGQSVTQGIVKGLELSASFSAPGTMLQVTPGYGISAAGEDVALLRTLQTKLATLQVIDPQTGTPLGQFSKYIQEPANTSYAGVLLLQPVTGIGSGATLDSGPLIISGNLDASCDQDPDEDAFADLQIVDGVRLVMVAWPSSPASLALPALAPAITWRNRLAYTVFDAELSLSPDDRLPWDLLGVPLAVIGFDATWQPQFVDRSTVARTGGLARGRYLIPMQTGSPLLVQPALAQARVNQLAEQIAATPGLNSLAAVFPLLPPCGVLPASSIDFAHREALWLPATWNIQAGPVHQEEVETVLLTSMTAQPFDVTKPESVEMIVPLPDALYDPDVLETEELAPAFQQAVDAATAEIAADLQYRKAIQQEANTLSQVLTGSIPGPLYNLDAGLTPVEMQLRDAALYRPTTAETFGTSGTTTGSTVNYASTDYKYLLDQANGPYTLVQDGNGNPLATPLPLFTPLDLKDVADNGLQHFISLITGRLSRANDLLDLAFLTTQSDIYRFRQYVLGATGAMALAVSPIAAEIATGESAASTAANLQSYLGTVLATTTPAPTTTAGLQIQRPRSATIPLHTVPANFRPATLQSTPALNSPTLIRQSETLSTNLGLLKTTSLLNKFNTTASAASVAALRASAVNVATFVPENPGTVDQPASTGDVLQQSPLVGAQLNLRTMTIAQRLANPPSQEGLFYSVGNRLTLLQLLAELELTIDDIPIFVDDPPGPAPTYPNETTTTPPPKTVYPFPTIADLRATADPLRRRAVLTAVQTPHISAPDNLDPDEASLFSTGIHVLEQHSSTLRAVEARIQQYNDFLTLCSNALTNVQSDLHQAQTLLTQLENDLAQARQDVAFTTALLSDENQRIAGVNAQRAYTLQNFVPFVVYIRPRTVVTAADVPSRQLVPGNVASLVPACLNQTGAIPPELREIVALLREAPILWMPSVEALVHKLERPTLLQSVAADTQARATLQLQLPLRVSSAAGKPGVYAPIIASLYTANQQAFRQFQTQRAAFQPKLLISQSWTSQVEALKYFAAPADLIASSYVHAEVVNATARLMQNVSNVATCLFARANQALPIDRLAWAEFLRSQGLTVELQSLAVLPNWNTQDYITRQQMQGLVDWLFLQIDAANANARAFISDVVRVSILLASDASANTVIAGAVALTVTPKVGGLLSLTLPSDRIAHGMYVQLYSAGILTAQAVVSDLDSTRVRATVTQVYKPGQPLQANDVAHFVTQAPATPALRAFDN